MRKYNIDKKKILDYEDAPSGYVTFYNYKEPLMKFKGGYGYTGVLLFDGKDDTIQCHFCGQWFGSLPHHLAREHNMKARDYKDKVGLFQSTALISESARAKLIASGLDKRLQNLRKGGKKSEELKQKIRATLIANGKKDENKNLRGTCPEQIIDRLTKIYRDNGNVTPSSRVLPFYEAMIKTFGSYKNTCQVAGIPYNDPLLALKRGREILKNKADKRRESILNFIIEFHTINKRLPVRSDYQKVSKEKDYVFIAKKGYKKELEKKAILRSGQYIKGFRFTPEELLEILRKFKEINNRKPSYSDARRGLIPYLSRYSYYFGGWKQALARAFGD